MTAIEYVGFRILRLLRKLPFNILGIGNRKVIFAEFFKDFDKVEAVKGIFGEKTDEVLNHLTVELSWIFGYMYVDGSDGHLVISKNYLNNGDKTDIYLDLIHELCQVKQYMEGKELFDPRYDYVERPWPISYYQNVYDAIVSGTALDVSPQHALDIMRALELGIESSRRGCKLPFAKS